MNNMIRFWRILALSGYFGLIALLLAWKAWLAPSPYFPVALMLIVLVVPLLFPLRGLLHGRTYTHAWSCFLVLFYFTHGVVEAVSNPPERTLAIAEIILSLMMFFGAVFYVRAVHAATPKEAA